MLKYQNLDYSINSDQTYLVVRGTNLSTGTGASYLWWLNGSNHGTQVAPTKVASLTSDGVSQTMVAWDMTKSGLYENFSGVHPSVCVGQTIFGLTSTTGQSDIHDICFVSDPDDYINNTVGIVAPSTHHSPTPSATYDLGGRRATGNSRIVVTQGRKMVR
jgi:hypothetical protein